MLVYKRRPEIESTLATLVYSLSSTSTAALATTDPSLIEITNSKFWNLNFGHVLKQLSIVSDYKELPI